MNTDTNKPSNEENPPKETNKMVDYINNKKCECGFSYKECNVYIESEHGCIDCLQYK